MYTYKCNVSLSNLSGGFLLGDISKGSLYVQCLCGVSGWPVPVPCCRGEPSLRVKKNLSLKHTDGWTIRIGNNSVFVILTIELTKHKLKTLRAGCSKLTSSLVKILLRFQA